MKYVLYCRKSTDTEDKQVLSLDAQERELLELAERHGLTIVNTIRESMSAKAPGRPLFNALLTDVQNGDVDGILCWKLDRLARNFIDGGQIIDLLQRGTLQSIRCFEKEYLPKDNVLLMAVELGMANQFVRDLSVNIKRGNRQKLAQGGWPSRAPIGYLNNRLEKTIEIDEVRAPYVSQAFELYATGRFSLKEVTNQLYEKGFRTPGGKKIHKSAIHRILSDPFYYGIMQRCGKLYPGKHQPLITKALFDQVQHIARGNSRPRRKRHNFTLTGLFSCKVCGCAITAERQKGYVYYHCTNGRGICDQKRLFTREEVLHEQIATAFEQLSFPNELIDLCYQSALNVVKDNSEYEATARSSIESALTDLITKEKRLLDVYINQKIDKDLYDSTVSEIANERINLQHQLEQVGNRVSRREAIERTKETFLACNRATREYLTGTDDKRRKLAFELLSNALLEDRKTVSLQYKSPYDLMASLPKQADFSTMRRLWDEVVTVISCQPDNF